MSQEVFNEGPTTSQHIESTDDDHFQTTTFRLKRTRSMGLLLDNSNILFNNNSSLQDPSSSPNNITLPTSAGSSSGSSSGSGSLSSSSSSATAVGSNSSARSTIGRTKNSKLTTGTYIPEETLSKLNLKTPNHHIQQQSQSLFRSNIINKKLENSPQSFQSEDFSDDLYNSEDSLSSPGSSIHNLNSSSYSSTPTTNSTNSTSNNICLIPKHQQKRYNQLHHNNNNNNNSSSSNSNPPAYDDYSSENNTSSNSPPQEHVDMTNILHDDIDVKDAPNEHVDYLTHKWEEDEISKSWKYVILRRKNVADSARLENASWRTWAQTRLGLKTISPEDLNWSKDSDVTWLYGPVIKSTNNNNSNDIHSHNQHSALSSSTTDSPNAITLARNHSLDNDPSLIYNDSTTSNNNTDIDIDDSMNISNNDNTSNTSINTNNNNNNTKSLLSIDNNPCDHLKSILKKKSKIEKMISDASYCRLQNLLEHREQKLKNQSSDQNSASSSPLLEPTISSIPSNSTITNELPQFNSAPNSVANSNSNSTSTLNLKATLPQAAMIKSSLKNSVLHIQQNSIMMSTNTDIPNEKKAKHIHFNMRVDQCIALDTPDHHHHKLINLSGHEFNDEYVNSSEESDNYPVSNMVSSTYKEDHDHYADDESDYRSNSNNTMYDDSRDLSSDSESDESDEGFVLGPTINNSNISHKPHEFNNTIKKSNSKSSKSNSLTTIAPLPATTLKFGSDDEYEYSNNSNNGYNGGYNSNNNSLNNINRMYTVSHNTKTNRGYDYYYDYNTVYSNNSNPMVYSSSNNVNQDVEMFDVPESCQIEESMDLDDHNSSSAPVLSSPELVVDSPSFISHYSVSNVSSANASPLLLPTSLSNSTVIDVPASFMQDIPRFEDDNDNQHIEHMQEVETIPQEELKRTSSIGSSSKTGLSSSMSSIKVGLSGLDLNTSGLRRSTGAGSKPQLFHLAGNTEMVNTPSSTSLGLNRTSSTSSTRNKFLFAESESESESECENGSDVQMRGNHETVTTNNFNRTFDEEGDDEMIDEDDHQQVDILSAVKSASSMGKLGSLADINRQFGGFSGMNRTNSTLNSNSTAASLTPKVNRSAFSFQNDSDSDSD